MKREPMPSRTGFASPLGKLTGWLERQRIEMEIEERLNKRAAALNMSKAAAVREVVRIFTLGPDEAIRIYGENAAKVVRLMGRMSDNNQ